MASSWGRAGDDGRGTGLTPPRTLYILEETLEYAKGQKRVVGLLRSKGSETFMGVLDGSLGEFWINSSESFAADFLVIGAGKMPRELDGGLFYGLLSW